MVSFRVTDPAGVVTTLSDATDRNGKAKVSYDVKASGGKKGSYQVTSVATKGASSATATTSFVVQ